VGMLVFGSKIGGEMSIYGAWAEWVKINMQKNE
jgi:hypothetical protein